MYLSIVIPAYNEEKRIEESISKIIDFVEKIGFETEIIVVNDGSKDTTGEIVKLLSEKYRFVSLISLQKNSGKAVAVKTGVLQSTGEIVLITDADLSTPIEELLNLNRILDTGVDIVYASRGKKESKILKRQNIFRELLGGRLAGILLQLLLVTGVKDTQCGFKLMNGKTSRPLFNNLTTTNSALWDMEILILAVKNKLTVAECPVVWVHNADTRLPYTLKYIFNTLFGALILKWKYKILLPVKVVSKY